MLALRRFLVLFFALGLAAPACAATSFTAVYDVSRGAFDIGTMRRQLVVGPDDDYRFESRTASTGLAALVHKVDITETSRGHLRHGRFVPDQYRYDDTARQRRFTLDFDYPAGIVRRAGKTAGWSASLPQNVNDPLIYQAQMMLDIKDAHPTTLEYAIAAKDGLKHYSIRNLGAERVDTGAGRFDTIRLERGSANNKRRTTVWCARSLDWLPVRVEYRERDGSVITAALVSVKIH